MFLRNTLVTGSIITSTFILLGFSATLFAQENPCADISVFVNEADGVPAAPTICSNDFATEDGWYQETGGMVWWNLPQDVVRVAYELMDAPDREPSTSAGSLIESVTLDEGDLHEGLQYLAVQFKNEGGWGAVGYYQIQIDTSAPELLSVTVEERGHDMVLVFNATDAVSYVDSYELSIDDGETVTLRAEEIVDGYHIPHVTAGNHSLTVTAYDAAGNSSTVTSMLMVPEGSVQGASLSLERIYDQYVRMHHLILLLAVIMMACLFFYIRVERRRYNALADRHARELAAVYKNAEDNFAALRAELYRNFDGMKAAPKKRTAKKTAVRKSAKKVAKKTIRRAKSDV